MSKFKVGDTVFHVGRGLGKVICVDTTTKDKDMAVEVLTYGVQANWFTIDGRSHLEHSIPQLYSLEEARKMGFNVPKIKIKKKITKWLVIHSYGYPAAIFDTEEEALIHINKADTIVELTGEYEVEE
jgi:hypothetical protein